MTRRKEEDARRTQKAVQPVIGGQTSVTPFAVEDGGWPKAAPWAGGQTPVTPATGGLAFGTTPAGWGDLPTKAAPVLREGQTPVAPAAVDDGGWPKAAPWVGDQTPATGRLDFGGTPTGWRPLPKVKPKSAWTALGDTPWVGGQTPITPATGEVAFGTTPAGWRDLPAVSKKVIRPKSLITPTPKSPTGRGSQGHGSS